MTTPAPDSSPARRDPSWSQRVGTSPIVVGVDGGPATAAVLGAAADAAELAGANLVIAYASDPPAISASFVGVAVATQPQDYEATLFPDVVEALGVRGVRWSLIAEYGDPATVLDRLAREVGARAIVIGSHTPGLLGRLRALTGHSVSGRLVRHCSVPIYVVPSHLAAPRN